LGGGEGHLAGVILNYWKSERPDLRDKLSYRIVEIGGPLQEKQSAAVQQMADAGWDVGWGRDLEEASAGSRPILILANEFLDTIPVHLVGVRGDTVREAYVKTAGPSLTQAWGELSQPASAELELLFGTVEGNQLTPYTEDGVIELFPGLEDLMRQVVAVMPAGILLNIDYGEWFPTPTTQQQWGLEGRTQRRKTIRGYFKHQLVDDPLARAGRQDLTADVDFGAVDAHGRRHGFETLSYATMAAFLRAGGAAEELAHLQSGTADAADPMEADRQATVLKGLLDDYDLGGAFKVMLQVRE
jgi:SAM-dependent MidA family methyltransferase